MGIEDIKLPNWANVTLAITMACLFLWGFAQSCAEARLLNAVPRYTIGYVTETSYTVGPSSHSNARFNYTVNGQKYSDSASGDIEEGCTQYLVKFAATDPKINTFYNHLCIPDSLVAPSDGWKKLPFDVPDYVKRVW